MSAIIDDIAAGRKRSKIKESSYDFELDLFEFEPEGYSASLAHDMGWWILSIDRYTLIGFVGGENEKGL